MAHRKRQRAFSRAERQAATAARTAMPAPSQDSLDRATILSVSAGSYDSPTLLAESWLGAQSDYVDYGEITELPFMRACERRFQALTGDALTVETAEDYIAAEEEHRNVMRYGEGF
jgi:hypothetical protein